MYSPRVLPHSGVSESQNYAVLEFFFTASAAGTPHVLIPAQSGAVQKVWFMTGDGSADMTSAVAQAICQRPDLRPLDGTLTNQSIGLTTYMTNVPAAADGAFCHAFAVGGCSPNTIIKAELVISPQSTSGSNQARVLINQSAAVNVHTIRLNGSNAFLEDDGTTAVAPGTDTLVTVGGQGPNGGASSEDGADTILFGAIKAPDVTDTPASGDLMTLRLYVKC